MLYDTWEYADVLTMDIDLDKMNPRIPIRGLSQRDLIADLIAHSHVLRLATAITEKGYYPTERLIVIETSASGYVVLEGNRRIAALKLLLSPELSPDSERPKFEKLSKQVQANAEQRRAISIVSVVITPSREAAYPIISDKHTTTTVEKWATVMQARFYYNMLVSGLTYNDITNSFKLSKTDLARFIRQAEMYEIACAMPLPNDVHEFIKNERKFPITSLERLYMNQNTRRVFGFDFSDEGRIFGKIKKREFEKGYTRVLLDLYSGDLDSRTLDTTEHINRYLSRLGQDTPDATVHDHFDITTFVSGLPLEKPEKPKPRDKPVVRRKQKGLIPKHIFCTLTAPKIQQIYKELRRIEVKEFPNATAILFRTFLQIVLIEFVKRHGALRNVNAARRGLPSLGELLEHVGADDCDLIDDRNIKATLRKAKSQKDNIASLDTLNAFAHNDAFVITKTSARETWQYFEPLMEIILHDDETK